MSAEKRAASASFSSGQLVKRQRSETDLNGSGANGALIHTGPSSGLSTTMEMSGHSGEVFAARFDPTGRHVASGSMDRSVLLWRASGECDNYGVLKGHKGAVLDLQWSRDSKILFTASADAIVASWDTETGQRIRRHEGHEGVVNALDISKRGEEILISGGDDGSIGLWDPRQKAAVDYVETEYPITAVAVAEAGNELYTGGIDNDIKVWDIRKKAVAYSLRGHTDTITSLQVSPDGQTLLSNSHDSTVRTWDIKPFAPENRHVKTFDGAPSGMEKNLYKASWDKSGEKIVAGSGDRSVVVWDNRTTKLLHKVYGHRGAVNDVRFSPTGEPLSKSPTLVEPAPVPAMLTEDTVLSASSDRTLMLGDPGT